MEFNKEVSALIGIEKGGKKESLKNTGQVGSVGGRGSNGDKVRDRQIIETCGTDRVILTGTVHTNY